MDMDKPIIAGIDIGTNSAHLVVARYEPDKPLEKIETHKSVLRLGQKIGKDGKFSEKTIDEVCDSLNELLDIAKPYGPIYRIVGTYAIRQARNRDELISKIRENCGVYLTIIDGAEEARLISLGMQEGLPLSERKFVGIDIGGGSTEIIFVNKREIEFVASLSLGAVVLSKQFQNKDGGYGKGQIRMMEEMILSKLQSLKYFFSSKEPIQAVISSGSAKTVARICSLDKGEQLDSDLNAYTLSSKEIEDTYLKIVHENKPKNIECKWDIEDKRSEIILAGCSVLFGLSRILPVSNWTFSSFGLREGLVVDTCNRINGLGATSDNLDIRSHILKFARKFEVDLAYAQLIENSCRKIYQSIDQSFSVGYLPKSNYDLSDFKILSYASLLHECGKFINFPNFHEHSNYLINNSRLLGLSQFERKIIGLVVRFHRKGRFRSKDAKQMGFSDKLSERINILAAILRIAVAIHKTREEIEFEIKVTGNMQKNHGNVVLKISKGCLSRWHIRHLESSMAMLGKVLNHTFLLSVEQMG